MSAPDERILGSYRLRERIGRGGMGDVYLGQHLKLGRQAAVKILPVNLANEADFLKRFEREAASAASLEHPNILPVWDYGEHAGTLYLVMPYIRSGTLKDRLNNQPLPLPEVSRYLTQMAEALDYAHERGIIHRDVKPANMLVDDRGRLYLSDFGIAKALEGSEGLTRTGVGVGTPEYMAPEQAQGRADSRSDLYALGVILYQLVTGRVPYSGNSTVEVLMKHMQEPLPLVPLRATPNLPPGLLGVLQKALAKNPNERYQTGRALVDAVNEALAGGHPTGPMAGDATIIGGVGGDRTIVGQTPPPGWGQPIHTTLPGQPAPGQPGSASPLGWGPPTGQATIMGGTPPPGWQPPAGQVAMPGGTPPPGMVPPPGGGTSPPGGTPFPGWSPSGAGTPAIPLPPAVQARPASNRRPLIVGGVLATLMALLLCGAIGAYALTRPDTNATATVSAGSTATVQLIAAATATANAPLATPLPLSPTSTAAPPTTAPVPTVASTPVVAAVTATSTARATSTSTAPPRPTSTPTPTARPTPGPRGTVPAGWKIYRGTRVPIVIAYPPDWTVDEKDAASGVVYFRSPVNTSTWMLVGTTGQAERRTADELRDEYYRQQFADCSAKAIDVTRDNEFSGITFKSVGTTCSVGTNNFYSYIGLGLNNSIPWRFRLNSPYDQYSKNSCNCDSANVEKYFSPMLATLNIYANP